MKLTPPRSLAIGCAAIAVALSSCTPYQQQGAAIGTLGGAAIGALAGDDSGDVIRGAAIGAAAGAGAAALKEESDRRAGYYNTGGDQPPPQPAPQPAKPEKTSNYPLATPVEGRTGQVLSPSKPHTVIDVRGFRTGQLARDPSTAPIDPATGKPDIEQAKIFEIP